jgi:putative signal transducing protein
MGPSRLPPAALRDQRHGAVHMLQDAAVDGLEVVADQRRQGVQRGLARFAPLVFEADDDCHGRCDPVFLTLRDAKASIDGRRGRSSPTARQGSGAQAVRELLRTNDPIRITRLRALLDDQGITTFLFDTHLSLAFAGALDLLGQRLMVPDEDYRQARRILAEFGEALPDE